MSESTPDPNAVTRLVTADERDEAVRTLTAAFTDDAIEVNEFERRVALVYRVESRRELNEIMDDLPATRSSGAVVPAPADGSRSVARRARQRFAAIASSVERSLDGPMPERLDVRAILGSVELDLRRAEFPPGVTEIRVRSVMGNIELELPSHVRVENDGKALLANFSMKGRTRSRGDASEPVVRIRGKAILANVEIEIDD